MQAQLDGVGAGASGALAVFRWLLMIALVVAVAIHLYMGLWELGVADQSASFYVTNLAIFLAPAVAYAAAVVLALTSRGGRVIWVCSSPAALSCARSTSSTSSAPGSVGSWSLRPASSLFPSCSFCRGLAPAGPKHNERRQL